MITIWGRNNAINVQKTLWAAASCSVKVNQINAGGQFGKLNTPEFIKLNPNQLIPVMQDENFTLWEANSIVRYIAEKYGQNNEFYPKTLEQRTRANQWLDWITSSFYTNLIPLFLQIYRTPEPQQNQNIITENLQQLNAKIPIANDLLNNNKFTTGNNITFGDMGLGTLLYRYFEMPINKTKCNNLEQYYQRLTQNEHFKTHCMTPLK